ncbi:hypothetical protein B0H34DRAFT_731219 [Crassisporium funariophilum]|nr:hypothetical protein B0H34DRAFT_731219 [Crassisporium funariophilum]
MPRRAPNTNISIVNSTPPPFDNIALLRRQWRWAAFSQFFYVFSQLFALNDVTLNNIEQDLTNNTHNVLPRVMHRLLYTLSYDRKISLDNWQTALRKQYNRRAPHSNPLGPKPERISFREKVEDEEEDENEDEKESESGNCIINHAESSVNSPQPGELAQPSDSDHYNLATPSYRNTSPSILSSTKEASRLPDTQLKVDEVCGEGVTTNWFDLHMLSKLESMHTLVEWQFQNPTRLRTIMKSDDDLAQWRIEPVGYDSRRNAYWFLGGNQLWIQRMAPKAAKPSKRKRTSQKLVDNPRQDTNPNTKRPRLHGPSHDSSSNKNKSNAASLNPSQTSGRHSRAAKVQAKLKLDAQAKELAELNRQAGQQVKTKTPRQSTVRLQPSRPASRPMGTRISARLRGAQEEEWQPIPHEWLSGENNTKAGTIRRQKTGLESDEETISDLTELSEELLEDADVDSYPQKAADTNNGSVSTGVRKPLDVEAEQVEAMDVNFVEWETICVTLEEWDHIAERFEKATHYTEKALYKILVQEIVPFVTEQLKEIEHKRQLEEALVHRKRSSRIAVKESEREEARLASKRKQEESEKQSRAKRMEARLQKEESERLKRESAREQRRKEREARELSRKTTTFTPEAQLEEGSRRDKRIYHDDSVQDIKLNGRHKSKIGSTRTPNGGDWELSCEICHQQGFNVNDATPMMSCGMCSKWQHIFCHDRADQAAGHPRRNWDAVEFICRTCRASRVNGSNGHYPIVKHHTVDVPEPQGHSSWSHQPSASTVPLSQQPPGSYLSGSGKVPQHNYYERPANGLPSNTYGPYSSSIRTETHLPATSGPRQTISFSHYQPTERGFSSSTQRSQGDPTDRYSGSVNGNQRYGAGVPAPYRPQPTIPAWNITTPTQPPGYPIQNNPFLGLPNMNSMNPYRQPPSEAHHQANESSSSAMPKYTSQPHYPSTQFKHHPASYQPPLGS